MTGRPSYQITLAVRAWLARPAEQRPTLAAHAARYRVHVSSLRRALRAAGEPPLLGGRPERVP